MPISSSAESLYEEGTEQHKWNFIIETHFNGIP